MDLSRRQVLGTIGGGGVLLLRRADAQITPEVMRYAAEIEPLVALIERTPRERCADMLVEQFRSGVSYRQAMAALFLAGIRNINPQPPGFALHCVFVIHSAHLMSLEAPADSRLLPMFYALDNFKTAQERDARQKDFTMASFRGTVPPAERAGAEFTAAMDNWDQERAERAVVSLSRNRSANEVFALLWRYGARDYRNIGHKAIFTANAYRTLEAIGWQYAEPVLRSLTLGLLAFGKDEKVNGYALTDQCYFSNTELLKKAAAKTGDSWASQPADPAAAATLIASIRSGPTHEVCAELASGLANGKMSAATVWDAVHLASAELSMRVRPAATIVGIHAVTAANGLHHSYLAAADRETRLLLLLQAVGWMSQFRTWAGARDESLRPVSIADLEPASDTALVESILASDRAKTDEAAGQVMALAKDHRARQAYLSGALGLAVSRADEVHYYKYLAALIEDIPLVSPTWQPHMTAASLYYMKRSTDAEPEPIKRAKRALRSLPA